MESFTLSDPLRLAVFLAVLAGCALAERRLPRRDWTQPLAARWLTNLTLGALNSLLVFLVVPLTLAGFAVFVSARQWGILNWIELPMWIHIAVSIIALDAVIYWQHRAFHRFELLWRVHRVHHADRDLDVSSGLRFHPLEIALSLVIKFVAIAALGTPVFAVVLFEVLLNASAMFNHSNLRLSQNLDTALRRLIVTPDMHRVHHSTIPSESNRNFGFFLAWWDYVFGSYKQTPQCGHQNMTLGLDDLQNTNTNQLGFSLRMPFRKRQLDNK